MLFGFECVWPCCKIPPAAELRHVQRGRLAERAARDEDVRVRVAVVRPEHAAERAVARVEGPQLLGQQARVEEEDGLERPDNKVAEPHERAPGARDDAVDEPAREARFRKAVKAENSLGRKVKKSLPHAAVIVKNSRG